MRGGLDKKAAVTFLKRHVPELMPQEDRDKFMALAEMELAGLHEGNFARFRIRPSEFNDWKANWK